MSSKTDRRGRPRGSRNTRPSKAAIAGYYRLLQMKADQGDVAAAGKLLELDLLDNRKEGI